MLSQDIHSLRKRFETFRHNGQPLRASQVDRMIETMRACEDQARQLERSTIGAPARLTQEHLADDKIAIFPILPRDTAYHQPGDGGSAA